MAVEKRRKSRRINYGDVAVGGGAPVSIQSMSTFPASAASDVLAEIDALARAGCEIVRVSVKDQSDIDALEQVCGASPIPVISDVHFDFNLAVASAGRGVAGIRINPGNIGGEEGVKRIVEAAAEKGIPIRVGVNSGSIESGLRDLYRHSPARALCESALRHLDIMEKLGFRDVVFSLKSSDPMVTVEANELFAPRSDYPLHLGVTESGPALSGTARSVVALTLLLAKGIGDTIRISLSGDPVREILVASAMLQALDLRPDIPEIISCPTCGRSWMDVAVIAERLEKELLGIRSHLTIAVMGCEVNGPGEAGEADIGIAGTRSGAVLFKKGKIVRTLKGDIVSSLVSEVREIIGKK
jgi:(E)-4-hydroxy-3-methylbut-2-enyl-diphosphate synthase